VTYPESLRPYIHYTTIGDNRIFRDEALPWNPTMYGFGFPIYQKYRGAVRFLVPYMDAIFNPIKFRLVYEAGDVVEQDLVPSGNGSAETFLLQQSQRWIVDHCGAIAADAEITLGVPFPRAGPAAVYLLYDHPSLGTIKLDEWTCYVSQFDAFKDHVAWSDTCLTVYYGPGGRSVHTACPTLVEKDDRLVSVDRWLGNRIDVIRFDPNRYRKERLRAIDLPLLVDAYPLDDADSFPAELDAPPASWRLPASMYAWLRALDAETGYRFARFAASTGARFNAGAGGSDALDGIQDTVNATTIEAVVDAQDRPYALWLRTPEPVDWRRVRASLRIRHVEMTDDCPTGYEKRHPLRLTIELLPSPDASSAFLIGSLDGSRTRLPRGEYELELVFDTQQADLTPLRPTAAVGGSQEVVKLKFLQPAGRRWPLPGNPIGVPGGLLEKLVELYQIDWEVIDTLLDPEVDPSIYERLIEQPREPPKPAGPGDPLPVEGELAALVSELRTVVEHLRILQSSATPATAAEIDVEAAPGVGPPASVPQAEPTPDDRAYTGPKRESAPGKGGVG
jgi:hypothetical protein